MFAARLGRCAAAPLQRQQALCQTLQKYTLRNIRRSMSASPAGNASRAAVLAQAAPSSGASMWRPHLLRPEDASTDWVQSLELDTARAMLQQGQTPPKILVLYGSLRTRSYSRLLAYEYARILDHLGAEVRVYDPAELPIKDQCTDQHPKVQELRDLSIWSEGQVWVSPEQHGAITAVFKNQLDWIPLSLGSVRPTQGRTVAVSQVNGGSQSFNAVNTLRLLGRWMRMFTIPNQSSVPKAWTEFDEAGRMKSSSYRDRVVDVAEELFKFTLLLRPHAAMLVDRYSEREEKRKEGRLLSQAEKEARKTQDAAAATTTSTDAPAPSPGQAL